jgi:hypothetical protein
MILELSGEEARELKRVLEVANQRLLEELVHADLREYRVALRRRLELLQRLEQQVTDLVSPAPLHG